MKSQFIHSLLRNKTVTTVISLILAIYATLAAPALPNSVIMFFDQWYGKLLFMFLIAFVASHSLQIAIIIAILFFILLHLGTQYELERFKVERFEDTDDGDYSADYKDNIQVEKKVTMPKATNNEPTDEEIEKVLRLLNKPEFGKKIEDIVTKYKPILPELGYTILAQNIMGTKPEVAKAREELMNIAVKETGLSNNKIEYIISNLDQRAGRKEIPEDMNEFSKRVTRIINKITNEDKKETFMVDIEGYENMPNMDSVLNPKLENFEVMAVDMKNEVGAPVDF